MNNREPAFIMMKMIKQQLLHRKTRLNVYMTLYHMKESNP